MWHLKSMKNTNNDIGLLGSRFKGPVALIWHCYIQAVFIAPYKEVCLSCFPVTSFSEAINMIWTTSRFLKLRGSISCFFAFC